MRTSQHDSVVAVPEVRPKQPHVDAPHPREQKEAAVEQCCTADGVRLANRSTWTCHTHRKHKAWGVFLLQTRRASALGDTSPSTVSTQGCPSATRSWASAGSATASCSLLTNSCGLSAICSSRCPSRVVRCSTLRLLQRLRLSVPIQEAGSAAQAVLPSQSTTLYQLQNLGKARSLLSADLLRALQRAVQIALRLQRPGHDIGAVLAAARRGGGGPPDHRADRGGPGSSAGGCW